MRPAPLLAILVVLLGPSDGWTQIVRVSVSTTGEQGNAASSQPSISGNGRFVAFSSLATNLVPGDLDPNLWDALLHDRDADGDGIFDEPGAIATVRVSRRADGASANGHSLVTSMTADGRFVVFVSAATDLVAGVVSGVSQVYRYDRTTDQIVLVSAGDGGAPANQGCGGGAISDDGRYVVFESRATNLGAPGSGPAIFLRDLASARTVRLSEHLPPDPDPYRSAEWRVSAPSISADGSQVAFAVVATSRYTNPEIDPVPHVTVIGSVHAVATGAPSVSRVIANGRAVWLSDDGTSYLVTSSQLIGTPEPLPPPDLLWNRPTGDGLWVGQGVTDVIGWSSTGQLVVFNSVRGIVFLLRETILYDLQFQRAWTLPFEPVSGSVSRGGRFLAFECLQTTIAPDDTNAVADIFVVDLAEFFDTDADTLDDRWETFYGLSTSSPSGADGAAGDPDGDGVPNAQEESAGTHPRGTSQRYLAEGASGTFFDTDYDVFNPSFTTSATGVLVFQRRQGSTTSYPLALDPGRHRWVPAELVAGLAADEFSVVLESDAPLVLDRTMTWAGTDHYGSHTESGIAVPSATWYLAEGSTVIDFNLFYLLQNPQSVPVTATVRFLRPIGAPIVRTYDLPPRTRLTIHVNDVPGLEETDVSAAIEATEPIVVERAMYADRPGQVLALGHGGLGAKEPAASWFLAEGATGTFFDTYVLIANPSAADAAIEARFLRQDGTTVIRAVTVAANSRFSFFVDAIPGLENTAVSTVITSTNAVPVVVERAMYWPGGFFEYYEGHSSVGTTTTATRWGIAAGLEGGFEDARTYVLIANVSSTPGQARIRVLTQAQINVLDLDLPPNSRITVPMRSFFTPDLPMSHRFPVVVESVGAAPVPIVVERATYLTVNGVLWAAGANALATPVP
jgi:hypothetical protein